MNREIEFRGKFRSLQQFAKPINEGQWVYGDLVRKAVSYCNSYNDAIYTIDGEVIPIDPDTVGEFTGLRDKHGKKVFEGDIVRRRDLTFEMELVGVVVYNSATGCFRIHSESKGLTVRTGFEASAIYEVGQCAFPVKYEYEVIGNRHDNSELLNEKKE